MLNDLRNVSATFQCVFNTFVSKVLWKTCLVYFSNKAVLSENERSRLKHF